MRTFLVFILALLLILCGVWIFGMAGVRIMQELGWLRMEAGTAETVRDAGFALTPRPLLAGVESGGMALGTEEPLGFAAGVAPEDAAGEPVVENLAPITGVITGVVPLAPVDPCAPRAEPGSAAETSVTSIGMTRLYNETDVEGPTSGEFGAGQSFMVTADAAGVTAVRRCELVWVRVRMEGGATGWVLAHAVVIAVPTLVAPTLAAPTPFAPICPGGCATPTCVQPCADPCAQPCTNPCNQQIPCGVYWP